MKLRKNFSDYGNEGFEPLCSFLENNSLAMAHYNNRRGGSSAGKPPLGNLGRRIPMRLSTEAIRPRSKLPWRISTFQPEMFHKIAIC